MEGFTQTPQLGISVFYAHPILMYTGSDVNESCGFYALSDPARMPCPSGCTGPISEAPHGTKLSSPSLSRAEDPCPSLI